MEGLGHIQENCAHQYSLVKVPGYSFFKAGQLQRSAVFEAHFSQAKPKF
jgi:hypothetical protein